MSFELFFNTYKHGETCGFALAEAETAFKQAIVHSEISEGGYYWRLEYPVTAWPPTHPAVVNVNGRTYPAEVRDCSAIYGTIHAGDGPLATSGFMVSGPAAHADFSAALLRLLQSTHAALFWGGENALVIGQWETVAHLPNGMIETLGAPFLVTEPEQIGMRIKASV